MSLLDNVGEIGGLLQSLSGPLGVVFGQDKPITTSSTTAPPAFAAPALENIVGQAGQLNQTQSPQFVNQYAGLSGMIQQGLGQLGNINPQASNAAQSMLTNTIGGQYLNPETNPYLQGTFDTGANAISGQMNSLFGQANRRGSGAMMNATGNSLANFGNQLFGGNYQAERRNQMNAAQMASGVDQGTMLGANALLQGGGIQQQDIQNMLAEQNRGANFGYTSGWDNLGRYLNTVQGAAQGYGTGTDVGSQNNSAQLTALMSLAGGLGAGLPKLLG